MYSIVFENNTAKYFFWKIQFFANLPKNLLRIKGNINQVQKHFTFNARSVLKNVNLP
jgi:hypothetical protein